MDEDRISSGGFSEVIRPVPSEGELPSEDTFIHDNDTFVDDTDLARDPEASAQHAAMIQAQRESREKRSELALAITKYLAKIPEAMSLPAAFVLAERSESEVSAYEAMYRRLDTELKNILGTYPSDVPLPSFDAFLDGGQANNATRNLRSAFSKYVYLDPRLHQKVSGLLELYAAFAENIGNAKYLQKTRREGDSHPLA